MDKKQGKKPTSKKGTNEASSSRALVPRSQGAVARGGGRGPNKQEIILAPRGYTMREVQPAKNYDVMSFAKAMNDDCGMKVKQLFQPETDAAIAAQKTGIYIGWRCPEYKHDCIRLSTASKCFCGHLLSQHDKFNGRSFKVPCKSCSCKAFNFIPARPEDVGEFWFQRRRNFDPSTWRCKCRCKHTHEEHDPNGSHRCKISGCGCALFYSASVCAACDRHTQFHETFFDTADSRKQDGLPYGEDYLPFAEIPTLRNMALTGEESDESTYLALTQGQGAIPDRKAITGNNVPVQFGGRGGGSNFKPSYD